MRDSVIFVFLAFIMSSAFASNPISEVLEQEMSPKELETLRSQWVKGYIEDVSLRTFKVFYSDPATVKRKIPITLAVDHLSSWKESRIFEEFYKMAKIFHQCGLGFSNIRWVDFQFTEQGKYITRPLDRDGVDPRYYESLLPESKIVKEIEDQQRPIIFFNEAYTTSAVNLDSVRTISGKKLRFALNTAWVSYQDYYQEGSGTIILKSFNVTAHELAHVLGNLKHISTDKPNLMNNKDGAPKGGYLNPNQCQQILGFAGS